MKAMKFCVQSSILSTNPSETKGSTKCAISMVYGCSHMTVLLKKWIVCVRVINCYKTLTVLVLSVLTLRYGCHIKARQQTVREYARGKKYFL